MCFSTLDVSHWCYSGVLVYFWSVIYYFESYIDCIALPSGTTRSFYLRQRQSKYGCTLTAYDTYVQIIENSTVERRSLVGPGSDDSRGPARKRLHFETKIVF